MKKVIALLFVALFLLASSVYAANMSELWKGLDPVSKQFIIIGYKEGLRDGIALAKLSDSSEPTELAAIETHQHKVAAGTYKKIYKTHANTIVPGMDAFYSDSSNRNIPVDYAIVYVIQKQNGISEEDSQADLIEIRKTVSEAEVKK